LEVAVEMMRAGRRKTTEPAAVTMTVPAAVAVQETTLIRVTPMGTHK
jgi:hypothetical protein